MQAGGARESGGQGKRVELQREDEQIAWLISKGQGGRQGVPGGFELLINMGEDEDTEGKEGLVPRVHVCCDGKQTGRQGAAEPGPAMTSTRVPRALVLERVPRGERRS